MADPNRMRRVYFKPGRVIKRNRVATTKAYDQITREMTSFIHKRISKPHPPPSRPGAHPHLRSGDLKRDTQVVHEGRRIFIRTLQRGIWLESGTENMKARPFIRRNVHDRRATWTRRLNSLIRQNVAKRN